MITIVIGCMYAGKTTYLLEKINYLKEKNSSYLVINHSSDTRYNDNCITNHNQESVNSLSLIKLCDLNIQNLDNIENLLIDEAQFFTDLYDTVLTFRNYKKTLNIILVGLDGDYKQNVFNDGQLLKLIPHCEELTKLYSKCYICGKKSSFTKRIISDNTQILVGDNNMYQPVCYKHL
jgi:thymidine kinase